MKIFLTICFLAFASNGFGQDVKIGGRTLKNLETRWTFNSNTEKKIKAISLNELGIKKVGLIYFCDKEYGFRKTSPIPSQNQIEIVKLDSIFSCDVENIVKSSLGGTENLEVIFIGNIIASNIISKTTIGTLFKLTPDYFSILSENHLIGLDALLVLSESNIPDYFTRTNTKLLNSKGYLTSLNKTVVYSNIFTQIIPLKESINPKTLLNFQQLSGKLVNSTDKFEFESFTKTYKNELKGLIIDRIQNNLTQILLVYDR